MGIGKEEYKYDLAGNMTLSVLSARENSEQNGWVGIEKREYIYDKDNDLIITSLYFWDNINGWKCNSKEYYYYASSTTGIDVSVDSTIDLFPNPTSDIIYITGLSQPAEVMLYSIQGRLLKTVDQVESTIDISDLPAGVYILNLTSGDQVLRERIVKR